MALKKKSVLITDLDNTLFDWVDLWFNCFSPMLDSIVSISGVSKAKLIPEISAVHQKHGTSEYSFLIEEVPSLKRFLKKRSAIEVFKPAIQKYQDQRRKHLHLYPTVAETLLRIKGKGAIVVGYTESMAFYSNYRIRRLGLDGVLDYVFCPEDHVMPAGVEPEDFRKYPATHYELKYTRQHFTPRGSKKPDKVVLAAIIDDLGLNKADCIYVGDNLMKDIAMAVDCAVDDVWAKYGEARNRPEYKLLREVTHWTPEEVEREKRIKERSDVTPTHTLEKSFSEILALFEFTDNHVPIERREIPDARRKQIVDVWKKIVEVQQHFNDIGMRIRSMFVTILLALFASIGFLLDKGLNLKIGKFEVQFAVLVPLFGIIGALLFYFIDRHWYHRLLKGAVNHGNTIESKYKAEMPELSLGAAISTESPYRPGRVVRWIANCLVWHKSYRTNGLLHSDGKIELFYRSVIVLLVLVSIGLACFGNVKVGGETLSDFLSRPAKIPSAAATNVSQAAAKIISATPQEPRSVPAATSATPSARN